MIKHSVFIFSLVSFVLILFLPTGCGSIIDYRYLLDADMQPPQLLDVVVVDQHKIELRFDEPVTIVIAPEISRSLTIAEAVPDENSLLIITEEAQQIGEGYMLRMVAADGNGNSNNFSAGFSGFNPRPPRLQFNEFSPQVGSSKYSDFVEVVIESDGNLGGIVFYRGSSRRYDNRYIFPAMEVKKGQFITIHCKAMGKNGEISERLIIDEASSQKSSADAWDIWLPNGKGLSDTTGIVSLYDGNDQLMDAIIYSSRTADIDDRYQGFGTKKSETMATEIFELAGWRAAGEQILPQDGVNPDPANSSKSFNRISAGDGNHKQEWYLAASSQGQVNNPPQE